MPERTSYTMIFVPLLHYFLCKNDYSGNEAGLRYRLTPGKRTVPDPDLENTSCGTAMVSPFSSFKR